MVRCLTVLAIVPLAVPCAIYLSHVLYFAGTSCESKMMLTGKTVIVTGANTGIGKTTASDMAARGARVILACRSAARALPVVKEIQESTKNSAVVFMQLDLASFQSVRDFARLFLEKEERLDVLINNAGMISSDEPKLSKDGIEMTLAVNHLGPFLLTNLLVDIMKTSGPGARVVTVSSVLHNLANPAAFRDFDLLKTDGASNFQENLNLGHMDNQLSQLSGIRLSVLPYLPNDIKRKFLGMLSPKVIRYNNSKLANILFAKELAKRLAATGVSSYALHPGVITTTEIGVERSSAGQNEPVPASVQGFMYVFGKLVKNQKEGAQTTICCAVSERFANESGNYYSDCNLMEVRRLEANPQLAAEFWDWSATVVGLKEN